MATVNGISDLPGIPKPEVDPLDPSSAFLTRYFDAYERQRGLAIERPVKATAVSREDDAPAGRLRVGTSDGEWSVRAVINATGRWTRPFWPIYPGRPPSKGGSSTLRTMFPLRSSGACMSSWLAAVSPRSGCWTKSRA